MTTFRVKKKSNPFVMIDKGMIFDDRLSFKAKGILAYAFSRPDDWKFYKSEILKHSKEKEKSLNSGLKELEDCGYLVKKPRQDKETGRLDGWEWTFFEEPLTEEAREEFKKLYRNTQKGENGEKAKTAKGRTTNKEETTKKEKQLPPPTKKEKVVVFSSLDNLDIKPEAKQKISKRFNQQEVDLAVSRVMRQKNVNDQTATLFHWLNHPDRWTEKETTEDLQRKKDELIEKNRAYAEKTIDKLPAIDNIYFKIEEFVVWILGLPQGHCPIGFSEPNFQELFSQITGKYFGIKI